jgi:hypothetical protein
VIQPLWNEGRVDEHLRAGEQATVDRPQWQDRVSHRAWSKALGEEAIDQVLDRVAAYGRKALVAELGQDLGPERLLVTAQGGGLIGAPGAGSDHSGFGCR